MNNLFQYENQLQTAQRSLDAELEEQKTIYKEKEELLNKEQKKLKKFEVKCQPRSAQELVETTTLKDSNERYKLPQLKQQLVYASIDKDQYVEASSTQEQHFEKQINMLIQQKEDMMKELNESLEYYENKDYVKNLRRLELELEVFQKQNKLEGTNKKDSDEEVTELLSQIDAEKQEEERLRSEIKQTKVGRSIVIQIIDDWEELVQQSDAKEVEENAAQIRTQIPLVRQAIQDGEQELSTGKCINCQAIN
ncbi:hypothetical protein AKO1_001729 [Acrasis kona]|uniref:Uncharacterized protein n=1 Tax=Acrasis kona TaxID=1008807 RepID=A0AAW2ZBJ3_9EUKA